jgi:hypothetical protein
MIHALRQKVSSTAGSSPAAVTTGPDGNLWFTENGADASGFNHSGRITTAGAISELVSGCRIICPGVPWRDASAEIALNRWNRNTTLPP